MQKGKYTMRDTGKYLGGLWMGARAGQRNLQAWELFTQGNFHQRKPVKGGRPYKVDYEVNTIDYKFHPRRQRMNLGGDLLCWRWRFRKGKRCVKRRSIVKPSRYIFDGPIDTLENVVSSHSTARHNRPLVGFDSVKIESLEWDQPPEFVRQVRVVWLTVRISELVNAPLTSCLFANTSKDAPASLC